MADTPMKLTGQETVKQLKAIKKKADKSTAIWKRTYIPTPLT